MPHEDRDLVTYRDMEPGGLHLPPALGEAEGLMCGSHFESQGCTKGWLLKRWL